MTVGDVPSWITVVRGRSPILLLAPHGGRRHEGRIPGQHRVNDLLTGDVTRALASACGASLIINDHRDRNQLDLNRLSQVRHDAPWMIHLLADMLAAMVSDAGHATVLVVHGWNVTQAACDVGIGMRERPEGLVPVRTDTATVSDAFVASRLRPLQEAAADAGIAVTIGSRYPAAHPNNLLQVFRGVADRDSLPCPIAAICRNALVEAAQLELAIPLRWPGHRRDRFLALLAGVFANGTCRDWPVTGERFLGRSLRSVGGRVTRRRGLQFVAGEMLVMTSIDAGETGPIAGRLVVSEDRDRLTLFTGELTDPSCAWTIPPLKFESLADGGARVIYEGPLVGFPTLTPFLDLERGLADGTLVEGRVDLTFQADDGPGDSGWSEERFGDVRGEMVVDGRSHAIAARGVATSVEALVPQELPSCRITLPSSPWGSLVLDVDREERPRWSDDGRLIWELAGTVRGATGIRAIRASCDLQLSANTGSFALQVVRDPARSERLLGTLERLIPVRRPGREGTVVETTFALVRVDDRYIGWIEINRATARSAPCP